MILDNLTRAFKTQNWFAVATEFVIVIAGVVIGFQITEWRAERADRAAEALYLDALAGELGLISTRLEENVEDIREYDDYIGDFLEAAEAGDLDAAKQRRPVFGALAITRVASEALVPASLNELLSSGRLPIIRNAELRNALASLPFEDRELQTLTEQLTIQQSQIVDAVSRRIIMNVGEEGEWIQGFHFTADDRDQELFRQLRYARYLAGANRAALTGSRDLMVEMRDKVCAEAPESPACQEQEPQAQAEGEVQ